MIKASQIGPTLVTRLVNMGEINNEDRMATRWLGIKKDYTEPLIIYYKCANPTLTMVGDHPFSEFINMDKVPSDFILSRINSPGSSGVVFLDSGTTMIRIFCSRKKMTGMQELLFDSIKEVLKNDYGVDAINAPWRKKSNDMVFVKDRKNKKFMGVAYFPNDNLFSFSILTQFNKEKVEGLYKLDNPKFVNKGEVNDISDVVGGLKEINPKINDDVVIKIINRLAQKMRWEIREDVLTEEERKIIDDTIIELATEETKDWILTGKI